MRQKPSTRISPFREGHQGHPPGHPEALLGGRQDFGSCLMVCVGNPALPSCAAARGHRGKACITPGPRSFLRAGETAPGRAIRKRAATSPEVKELRRGNPRTSRRSSAEQALELRLLKKKHDRGWGRSRMRYPASEKALRSSGWSSNPRSGVRRTLEKTRRTARPLFYRWYDQYQRGGTEALGDRSPRP